MNRWIRTLFPAKSLPATRRNRLSLLSLEDRTTPAVHRFIGGAAGGGFLWSNPGNWSGGVPTSNEAGGTVVRLESTTSLDDINGLTINRLSLAPVTSTQTISLTLEQVLAIDMSPVSGITSGIGVVGSNQSYSINQTTGYLQFQNGALNVDISATNTLNVNSQIVEIFPGASGVHNVGLGTLVLNEHNLFNLLNVDAGKVVLIGDQAQDRLPAKSTVNVNAGATLEMANSNPTPQADNAINLNLNGGTYQVSGATNGGTHLGNVTFNNGGTIKAVGTISSFGDFNVSVNGNIAVTGNSDGAIDLPNGIGIGSAATIDIPAGRTLTLSPSTGVFDSNTGTSKSLVKNGAGTLTINGTIDLSRNDPANSGNVTVSNGTLLVNGTFADGSASQDVIVNSIGTLGGSGNILGTVQLQSGGAIVPGNGNTPATLSTGPISFQSGSFYNVKINGSSAGQFDSLKVTGTVDLGNTLLTLNDTVAANKITIIDNDGSDAITGTFSGIPEGGILSGNKSRYIVSYKGGDGNDVTLTPMPTGPYLVDNTGDADDGNYAPGQLTLREAIRLANLNPGADTITFKANLGDVVLTSDKLTFTDTTGATTITGPTTGTQVVTRSNAVSTPAFVIFFIGTSVPVNISGLTISNGNASGILSFGTLTIANSSITANTAVGPGGGITNAGTLTILNSTISGNSASDFGGGIYNTGTLTISNSTISGNTANGDGGGIVNTGTLTLKNVTMTLNKADADGNGSGNGGGIFTNNTNVLLTNSIVAGNVAGTGTKANDVNGTLAAASSNNIIGDSATAGGLTNDTNANIVGIAVATVLNPTLASNGGQTKTHALATGDNPAIGSGTKSGITNTDQRGFVRPVEPTFNPDIGSYELQLITINPGPNPVTGLPSPIVLTDGNLGVAYSQQLTASFPNQPAGTTYTFTTTDPLPAGLVLSPAGLISGTPTVVGASTINITATSATTADFTFPVAYSISVTANTPPVANPDTATTSVGTATIISVLANDTDANGDVLSIASTTNPANGTVSINGGQTITYTPKAGFSGSDLFTYTISDGKGGTTSAGVSVNVTPTGNSVTLVGFKQFAVGQDAGSGTVKLFNSDGSLRLTLTPFGAFTGGIRTAAGDFNGDGIADLVAGTGPGSPTHVRILDGVTAAEIFSVDPFESSFTGGVYVAVGDVNGDGKPDLAITPDEGGGPRVDVFSGADFRKLIAFFGIDDSGFRGGARASIADLNGDTIGDLLIAAGFGGGPRVAGFDGRSLSSTPRKIFGDFFAFEQTLRNGIFITAGDINGDGFADLICGGGPGGGPRVLVFDGAALNQNQLVPLANFFGGNPDSRGGIRIAVKDLDGDKKADLVVGSGASAGSHVTAYLGKNIPPNNTPTASLDFDAFAGFTGGVFIG